LRRLGLDTLSELLQFLTGPGNGGSKVERPECPVNSVLSLGATNIIYVYKRHMCDYIGHMGFTFEPHITVPSLLEATANYLEQKQKSQKSKSYKGMTIKII
jgi:hypothetical protein